MKKRTIYRVIYSFDYDGIANYLTENNVLPEDIVDIRKDGSAWKAMYVKEIIETE